MGRWQHNAPRLAGMDDWYLVRQLNNFQAGIRGGHPRDQYGSQMVDMSQFLADDRSIREVVSYINSLESISQVEPESAAVEE